MCYLSFPSLTVLRGANLGRADLEGADLTGADLVETNLRGTDLEGVIKGCKSQIWD